MDEIEYHIFEADEGCKYQSPKTSQLWKSLFIQARIAAYYQAESMKPPHLIKRAKPITLLKVKFRQAMAEIGTALPRREYWRGKSAARIVKWSNGDSPGNNSASYILIKRNEASYRTPV